MMIMPKALRAAQCFLLFGGLLLLAACFSSNQMIDEGLQRAKEITAANTRVLDRVGAIRKIDDLNQTGSTKPSFRGVKREQSYVLYVQGERDSVYVNVSVRRIGSAEWELADLKMLDARDASQYMPATAPLPAP